MKIRLDYLPFMLIFLICIVVIILMTSLLPDNNTDATIAKISSERIDWYVPKEKDNIRPIFPEYVKEYIQEYDIKVIGKEDTETYLTFNCGYEYENYTNNILDILQKNDVKAAFFITGDYLRSNPIIVKRMVQDGHIVGNHGNKHALLTKLNREGIKKEILDFELSFREIMGIEFEKKYYRPASGTFSEEVLSVAKEQGYKTIFWSFAYKDWETDNQPNKDEAYQSILDYTHKGSIIMLHTVSKSNVEILGDIITNMKSMGYEFKSIEELY